MLVDWGAEVVEQIDTHWRDQLRPRLDGLTDDELVWQPSAAVPTIAWRLEHVATGLEETNETHFGGPGAPRAAAGGTAVEALRRLDDAYGRWIDGVRALRADGLAAPQGPTVPAEFADAPMVRLVLYTSVEIIHHGAEACLLRDLHLDRRRPAPGAAGSSPPG